MFKDAAIGSTVVLYHFGKIIEKATIEDQTACYWKLSNGQQFQKKLGYYFESYNKSKRIDVKFWDEEIESTYQAHIEKEQAAAVLSSQKSKLHDYIQYMGVAYFSRISSGQVAAILSVCQNQIGNISTPRIR